MPGDQYRYAISESNDCPKCGDDADPTLKFMAKTSTLPERIRVSCGTCGWVAGDRKCVDAPATAPAPAKTP